MLREKNVRPNSVTTKLQEQSTDASIIDAESLSSIRSASGLKLSDNLVGRTILTTLQMESQGVLPDVS